MHIAPVATSASIAARISPILGNLLEKMHMFMVCALRFTLSQLCVRIYAITLI